MSVHLLFAQLVPRVVGFCLCFGPKLTILEFLKSGQTGRTFSLFSRIGYNGLPEHYCTRYRLESIVVRAVSCGCWGFRTCFAEGKAEYFQ